MRKKVLALLCALSVSVMALAGCGSKAESSAEPASEPAAESAEEKEEAPAEGKSDQELADRKSVV